METDPKQIIIDFKETFGSEQGKRTLARLMILFGHKGAPSVIDPDMIVYEKGQSVVMDYIINKVESELDEPEEENTDTGKETNSV